MFLKGLKLKQLFSLINFPSNSFKLGMYDSYVYVKELTNYKEFWQNVHYIHISGLQ